MEIYLRAGTEACILHHNMASLSKRYAMMLKIKSEKERVLSLETIQPIVNNLRGRGAIFN